MTLQDTQMIMDDTNKLIKKLLNGLVDIKEGRINRWNSEENKMAKKFVTKDSGERQNYDSGMRRDTDENKPRFDLVYQPLFKRWAELMQRGAVKYTANNWQKANSLEELARFKASAYRHFFSWFNDENPEEDHAAGVLFNIAAVEYLKEKLGVDINGEQWAQPNCLNNYEVSNTGKVRRIKDQKIMAQWKNKWGYMLVSVSNEERKSYQVHRLIAEAFIGKNEKQVNHIDGNKTNNNIENLEYCTASENNKHAFEIGLRTAPYSNAKITYEDAEEIRFRVAGGEKQTSLVKEYKLSPQTINDIIKCRIWNKPNPNEENQK